MCFSNHILSSRFGSTAQNHLVDTCWANQSCKHNSSLCDTVTKLIFLIGGNIGCRNYPGRSMLSFSNINLKGIQPIHISNSPFTMIFLLLEEEQTMEHSFKFRIQSKRPQASVDANVHYKFPYPQMVQDFKPLQ